MIGIDTNILLRYLLADHAAQTRAAVKLIDETCSPQSPAIVCDVVIAETAWFLARQLRLSRTTIAEVIHAVLDNTHIRVISEAASLVAVHAYREGPGDFADYLVAALNREHGVTRTYTFDKDAARDGSLALLNTDG